MRCIPTLEILSTFDRIFFHLLSLVCSAIINRLKQLQVFNDSYFNRNRTYAHHVNHHVTCLMCDY